MPDAQPRPHADLDTHALYGDERWYCFTEQYQKDQERGDGRPRLTVLAANALRTPSRALVGTIHVLAAVEEIQKVLPVVKRQISLLNAVVSIHYGWRVAVAGPFVIEDEPRPRELTPGRFP